MFHYRLMTDKFFLESGEYFGTPKQLQKELQDKYNRKITYVKNNMVSNSYFYFINHC